MEFRSFQVACSSSLCVVYDVTVEIPAAAEGGLRWWNVKYARYAGGVHIENIYFFYFGFFYKQILISSSCGIDGLLG